MSWNDEYALPTAMDNEWHDPASTGYQQSNQHAASSSNTAFGQLNYAPQDSALYMSEGEDSLWPYDMGLDPAYSLPGSSVSSIPLEDIDWQAIVDSGEGPSPSSDDKTKRSRRQEQNRAAQRAFRERKDRALVDLQKAAKISRDRAAELEAENARLRDKLKESKVEIETLRSVSIPSKVVREGVEDVGFDVSCQRMTNEDEDVIMVKIKLGEAEGAEK